MGMANPAELLLGIFSSWNKQGKTAESARSDGALSQHFQAARLITEIEELLDVLDSLGKRTCVYRRQIPAWKKTLFNYPRNWKSSDTGVINQTQLDHLDTLVDKIGEVLPVPEQARIESLKGYLDKVLEELAEDDSLSPAVRDSAIAVTNNVIGCIDDLQVLGTFAFSQAFERLLGCLAIVALRSKKKSTWKRVLDGMIYPYAVNNLPSLEAAGATFKSITSAVTGQ